MFSLIVDVVFRPISGIKDCIKKANLLDAILILIIIIFANSIALNIHLNKLMIFMAQSLTLYIVFYGSLVMAGSILSGKKLEISNNFAYPFTLLPFSILSSAYITLNSNNKQYLLVAFIFVWEAFLEFLYVKESFKDNHGSIKILDSILIVIYAYLMRIFIVAGFILSNKFYWMR